MNTPEFRDAGHRIIDLLPTILILLFLVLVSASHGYEGETQSMDSDEYDSLLSRARDSDGEIDFLALRLALTRSPQYDPYAHEKANAFDVLEKAGEVGGMDAMLGTALRLLSSCYLNVEAHSVAAAIYRRRGDNDRAEHHRRWYRGLVGSVLNSGDGHTAKSAYQVIDLQEEYAAIALLQELSVSDVIRRELKTIADHVYDVFEVTYPDSSRGSLYFNVDLPMTKLQSDESKVK